MKEAVERITEYEWQDMLEQSRYLQDLAERAKRAGNMAEHRRLWAKLRPLNERIRSRRLGVVRPNGTTF